MGNYFGPCFLEYLSPHHSVLLNLSLCLRRMILIWGRVACDRAQMFPSQQLQCGEENTSQPRINLPMMLLTYSFTFTASAIRPSLKHTSLCGTWGMDNKILLTEAMETKMYINCHVAKQGFQLPICKSEKSSSNKSIMFSNYLPISYIETTTFHLHYEFIKFIFIHFLFHLHTLKFISNYYMHYFWLTICHG